jgi:hypothetical protein
MVDMPEEKPAETGLRCWLWQAGGVVAVFLWGNLGTLLAGVTPAGGLA